MTSDETEEAPLPLPTTTIQTISSTDYLRSIWKRSIRKALRQTKFSDFYLAADAVQYAAYEWGLDPFLARLSSELVDGSYSPEPADIIRGAKGRGLSRPLAFLAPRDALVYHAIVSRALPDLVKELRPWTGATMKHNEKMPVPVPGPPSDGEVAPVDAVEDQKIVEEFIEIVVETDYGNFFERWLQKQGVVHSIIEQKTYVVESDVANYFSSIDLGIVQEYLLRTGLHRDVVRLLIHLVKNVLRHPQYAESPALGLPQEPIDSSRHIAHGLLVEVDREFDELGVAGLYGRFMDDFVAGASSMAEAEQIIARLQRRLEPLGLYPNPAKTRVFEVDEYKHRIMVVENSYLDAVEDAMVEVQADGLRKRTLEDATQLDEFIERTAAFRSSEERPAKWDRVLRRYYRYLRELGRDDWLPTVIEDLTQHPDSAPQILEYVRSFPLEAGLVDGLLHMAGDRLGLYGNLPLIVLEAIATAPTNNSVEVSQAILKGVEDLTAVVEERGVLPRSQEDWMLAYLIPLVAKFADQDVAGAWLDGLSLPTHPVQAVARLHALPLQVSLGTPPSTVFVSEMAGMSWSSVLTLDFIRALESGDPKSRGVAIGLMSAEPRLLPNRFQMHSRSVSLLRIAAQRPDAQLQKVLARAADRLDQNPAHLKDHVMIETVSTAIPEEEP